ncbi:ComEC/Rec2 family competence protein [Paenibacillus sp. W2I17]|uniref:ComEC/Rec2 family competence protein n=1 Tax=Paenibacillus sp. W2I17 TaxID=3042311 RepID=UPI0027802416|nr:MBL fold metallo-hydrolase [Paenibacillus sp. W2I17]MDQ0660927.1 beta-lactamase superfamily II metal-dependent hydrolase [Paenibacillus sp. W2I17]
MNTEIMALPALDGDCFLIRFGEKKDIKNILVDGGRGPIGFQKLKKEIHNMILKNEFIDLLVLTHVDRDHIQGILSLFKDKSIPKNIFRKIWFNSGRVLYEYFSNEIQQNRDIYLTDTESSRVSIAQGIQFESIIETLGISNKDIIKSLDYFQIEGATFTILSPNIETLTKLHEDWETELGEGTSKISFSTHSKDRFDIDQLINDKFIEDKSLPNKTSIAFIFEYRNKKILMLGDSHPSIIVNSLEALGYSKRNKLKIDLMKVSHHGSKYNTSDELLQIIECKKFLISTNGVKHGVPDKECLARIINSNKDKTYLYFNYKQRSDIFTKKDMENYDFECILLNSNQHNYHLEV